MWQQFSRFKLPTFLQVGNFPIIFSLLLFFALALHSVVADAPTMDEQNHLTRGLTFLATGDPRFSLEHPPLVNTLSALPVYLLTDVVIPLEMPAWEAKEGWYRVAEALLWEANDNPDLLIFLARLPIIFLTMGLALTGYHFGNQFWDGSRTAGFMVFFLLLFDPNIIAHGRYTTTDVGGMTFLFLAVFLLWRLWVGAGERRWIGDNMSGKADTTFPRPYGVWWRWLWAVLGLGLAFSSKLSTLTFVPILGVMALLPLSKLSVRSTLRRILLFLTAGLASILVVWGVFGFEWKPFFFQSEQLAFLNNYSGVMPTFFAGIEQILLLSDGNRPSYLLGEFSDDGFPLYFPIAFLVKTPVLILIAIPVALFILLRNSQTRKRAVWLGMPAFLYFILSTQSSLNIGYRHLFPMLPFLYMLIAGLFRDKRTRGQEDKATRRLIWLLVPLSSLLLVLPSLLIHPHYPSYFNLPSGGAKNGWRILIDSNIDWGQDLHRLEWWMLDNDVGSINLGYFGTADPHTYRINYDPLPGLPHHFDLWWNLPFDPQNPAPGMYAISVSNLGEPPMATQDKVVYQYFRDLEPTARIGYSINIYEITE